MGADGDDGGEEGGGEEARLLFAGEQECCRLESGDGVSSRLRRFRGEEGAVVDGVEIPGRPLVGVCGTDGEVLGGSSSSAVQF